MMMGNWLAWRGKGRVNSEGRDMQNWSRFGFGESG